MPPPAVFVVGAPRSGTTLVRLMLDSHPQVAIPHETSFVPRALALGDDAGREALARFLTEFPTWPDLATSEEELREALARVEPFTLADGLRAFYLRYAAARGKTRWGDKTPSYALHLPAIAAAFPEARFVHVLRDGRDVAVSLRPLWFAPGQDMTSLAREWSRHVVAARAAGAELGPRYLELRYEDLLLDPRAELSRATNLLELPFAPEMLRYFEGATARLREGQARHDAAGRLLVSQEQRLRNQELAQRPLDPARVGRWRAELSAEEVAEFTSAAGGLLASLGYST
ncbi:MAG TPA: sulfotransferase [Thermoanaerobaculia bacterium]|nr:sulfotransferase [Thermoanaerobaculia bacterium]